jgi:hypothetical protein
MRVTDRCSEGSAGPNNESLTVRVDHVVLQAGETPTMRLSAVAHHIMPFVALGGGILTLLMPRLLNYVVAIYLILVGVIALNGIYHFVR